MISPTPLSSPREYETYVYTLREHHPRIQRSTLVYIPSGALFGRVEGMILPSPDISFTRPNLPFLIAQVEQSFLDN